MTEVAPYTLEERSLLREIRDEVGKVLQTSCKVRDEAQLNLDFYNLENHLRMVKRPAESDEDFAARPKLTSSLTKRVMDVLSKHLYNPGPARRIASDADCDKWLQDVYRTSQINAVFQAADKFACLNGTIALQVAATGDPAKPILIHFHDRCDFEFWPSPDNPKVPFAVCTISRYDETTTFVIWTRLEYITFKTKKVELNGMGGRVADYVADESETHNYGCLPFAFVHDELPVRTLDVPGIGSHIRRANAAIDVKQSNLGQSVEYYGRPAGFTKGVDTNWRPLMRPGSFQAIPEKEKLDGQSNDAEVFYLQPNLDIEGCWNDISRFKDDTIEESGVPLSAVRMNQSAVASGTALMSEQMPLLTRAKERQQPFAVYETELAKVVLTVGGNYYGKPELLTCAETMDYRLIWPEPRLPMPGDDRNQEDQADLQMGQTSEIEIMMRRRGITREEALEQIEQLAKDQADAAKARAKYPAQETQTEQSSGGNPENEDPPAGKAPNPNDSDDPELQDEDDEL